MHYTATFPFEMVTFAICQMLESKYSCTMELLVGYVMNVRTHVVSFRHTFCFS